ncbi:PR domain zinc finger protein 2-like [Artemia franciscana]|uniref:PR domain zinc finger protein 2-like n=1 Tax=Artemia franciscana TaxID=6661 RepID=UPI0032DA3AE5
MTMEAMETIYLVDNITGVTELEDIPPTNNAHLFGSTCPVPPAEQEHNSLVVCPGTSTKFQPDSDPLSIYSATSKMIESEDRSPTNNVRLFGTTCPVPPSEQVHYSLGISPGTSKKLPPDSDSASRKIIELEDISPSNNAYLNGSTRPVLPTEQEPYSLVVSRGTSTKLQPELDPLSIDSASSKTIGPPPPPGALKVVEVGVNFACLTWARQTSAVDPYVHGYFVQMREATFRHARPGFGWRRFGIFPQNAIRLSRLLEGRQYECRVFAQNQGGLSHPSTIIFTTVKNIDPERLQGPFHVAESPVPPKLATYINRRKVASLPNIPPTRSLMRIPQMGMGNMPNDVELLGMRGLQGSVPSLDGPLPGINRRRVAPRSNIPPMRPMMYGKYAMGMGNISRPGGPLIMGEQINSSMYRSDGRGQLELIDPNSPALLEALSKIATGNIAGDASAGLLLSLQDNITNMKLPYVTEKPFECNICKKRFLHKHGLHRHQQRHVTDKRFKCFMCNQASFPSEIQLTRHMAIHDGRKLYECDVCKRKYPQTRDLEQHRRAEHPGAKAIEFHESAKGMKVMKKKGKIRHSSESSSSLSDFGYIAAKRKKEQKKKNAHDSRSSSSSSEFSDTLEQDEEYEQLFQSDHDLSHDSDVEILEDGDEIIFAKTADILGNDSNGEEAGSKKPCQKCGKTNQPELILICDQCGSGLHTSCLKPALELIPEGDWYCPSCSHVRLINSLRLCLLDYDQLMFEKAGRYNRKSTKKQRTQDVSPLSSDDLEPRTRKGKARLFKTLRLTLIDCVQPMTKKEKLRKIESLEKFRAGDRAAQEMLDRQVHWRRRSSSENSDPGRSDSECSDSSSSSSSENYVPIGRPSRDLSKVLTRTKSLAKEPVSQKKRKHRQNLLEHAGSSDSNSVLETKTRLQPKRRRKQCSQLPFKPTSGLGKHREVSLAALGENGSSRCRTRFNMELYPIDPRHANPVVVLERLTSKAIEELSSGI